MKFGKARFTGLPRSCRTAADVLLIAVSMLAADWIDGHGRAMAQENLPVLTQVTEVRRLSPLEARRGYPVRLRDVVTFNQPGVTFIQDATAGIYLVTQDSPVEGQAGDLVEVRGITGPGEFAPVVDRPQVQVLGRAELPFPRRPRPTESWRSMRTGKSRLTIRSSQKCGAFQKRF